jgi:endo-alpha-1,4-polygalactosaminidase (GH114 family)
LNFEYNFENNKNNLKDENIKFSKGESKIKKILEQRPHKIIFDNYKENDNFNNLINSIKIVKSLKERDRKVILMI